MVTIVFSTRKPDFRQMAANLEAVKIVMIIQAQCKTAWTRKNCVIWRKLKNHIMNTNLETRQPFSLR